MPIAEGQAPRQFGFRNLARQARAQRREPFPLQGQIATLRPGIVMITFGSAERASTRWPSISLMARRFCSLGFVPVTPEQFCRERHRDRRGGDQGLEHDPESGNRFSEKIMLKQRDEIMIRFDLIGS
jgi:hypothetical protein